MSDLFSDNFDPIETDEKIQELSVLFGYDAGYVCQAGVPHRKKAKEFLESLWIIYEPYADSNFREEFKTNFTQRAWELYLGGTMLNRGLLLGSHNDNQPDLDVLNQDGSRLAWVEAIAVNQGSGSDRVPDIVYGHAVSVPTEEMLLRITQALEDKYKQYLRRVADGRVKEGDPYVIAIDRSLLGHAEHTPLILRVAYGIGNPVLRIPLPDSAERTRDWSKSEASYARQEVVAKKNGQQISSTFFLNPEHAGISAVIYSTHSSINLPRTKNEMGESFIIALNPHATAPVAGAFPFGQEYNGNESGASVIRPRNGYTLPDAFEHLYQ